MASAAETPSPVYNPKMALGIFLAVVGLFSFLPHRERELLFGGSDATGFAGSEVSDNTFSSEFASGFYAPETIGMKISRNGLRLAMGDGVPPGARRTIGPRTGGLTPPTRTRQGVLPGLATPGSDTLAAAGPTVVPLGGGVPTGGSGDGTGGSGNPGGSGGFGPGSGGFGGTGGGGSIIVPPGTGPVDPTPPTPLPAIPEPSVWIVMIFGFALIGSAMRRAIRQRSGLAPSPA